MKKYIVYLFIIICITLTTPILAAGVDFEFKGGLYRFPVNESVTVTWDSQMSTGYELKIIYFFYPGLETEVVETTETTYTFTNLPKSSKHFEIQVRSYNENSTGIRAYSTWSRSTNDECSVVDGSPGGWLIYSYPGTPSW